MTTDNPDPLEVWHKAVDAYDERLFGIPSPVTRADRTAAHHAAAAIIAQHYAPAITDLEALVGELGEALVTAMIPIEALLLSGADAAHCQDVRDAMHDAQATARATLAKLEKARGKGQAHG